MEMTRWISNQSKIPMVYTGTDAALGLIEGDVQIARRFERLALTPWEPDAEFAGFVKAYLRFIPLREPTVCDRELSRSSIRPAEGLQTRSLRFSIERRNGPFKAAPTV